MKVAENSFLLHFPPSTTSSPDVISFCLFVDVSIYLHLRVPNRIFYFYLFIFFFFGGGGCFFQHFNLMRCSVELNMKMLHNRWLEAWSRGYFFFKLNSAEHEIYPTNKC